MNNIKTDNTKTLENALAEVGRLQSENEALKAANRDLQDWFDDARATAEKAQARVAECHDSISAFVSENERLQKIIDNHDSASPARILRKQAEAVDAMAKELKQSSRYEKPGFNRGMATSYGFATGYAQRLRQQADELEAGSGD